MSSSNVVAITGTTANRAGPPHETAQVPIRPVDSISNEPKLGNRRKPEQDPSTAPVTPVGTKLVIDPVVRSWIPPRSAVELAWLTAGTPDVANNPILVWKRGAELVVLEDADFAERCQMLGIEPRLQMVELASEDEVRRFILDRQLGRPQLGGLRLHYVRGARYNLGRAQGQRSDLNVSHQVPVTPRAKQEDRWGCSVASIERDGRLARIVDQAAENHGFQARVELLEPRHKLTVKHIERFAARSDSEQKLIMTALAQGNVHEFIRGGLTPPRVDTESDVTACRTRTNEAWAESFKLLADAEALTQHLIRLDLSEAAHLAVHLAKLAERYQALSSLIKRGLNQTS